MLWRLSSIKAFEVCSPSCAAVFLMPWPMHPIVIVSEAASNPEHSEVLPMGCEPADELRPPCVFILVLEKPMAHY